MAYPSLFTESLVTKTTGSTILLPHESELRWVHDVIVHRQLDCLFQSFYKLTPSKNQSRELLHGSMWEESIGPTHKTQIIRETFPCHGVDMIAHRRAKCPNNSIPSKFRVFHMALKFGGVSAAILQNHLPNFELLQKCNAISALEIPRYLAAI